MMSRHGEGVTENMQALVDGLFQLSFGLSDAVDHETLAMLFAAEYLLSYGLSQPMPRDKNMASIDIAKIFSVPEVVVATYGK
jgi:hypothetical protein